ncbi:MAG: shikimate dehydrogenase [Clostridia bacterium]|jgi:shikimate dehydrogenase|nr:shikimate dehydrogenase [Clostridia bacterium]
MITGRTFVLGVIGWPVEHSVSPAMHNAALAALNLDGVYVAFPVPPAEVGAALEGLWALGVRGANVTIPHKQAVLPHLSGLSPEARAAGAVNTLVRGDTGWVGYNTDGPGFMRALAEELGSPTSGLRALLLGAGGAARAVAFALAGAGAEAVTVANRSRERGQALVRDLADRTRASVRLVPLEPEALAGALAESDLLVNCLPVGMYPRSEEMPPVPADKLVPPLMVCDLIYNPRPTRLLLTARAQGCRVMDGLAMLVAQGALAFELWTGRQPPKNVMRKAAEEALGQGGGRDGRLDGSGVGSDHPAREASGCRFREG